MGKHKTTYTLDSITIKPKANELVYILRHHTKSDPCTTAMLMEKTGMTEGQIRKVIQYMRRCSEHDLDKYIPYYPISTKKGYYLPSKWSDFVECYITLQSWANSLNRTVQPMKKKMIKEGVDWRDYIKETHEFEGSYFDELDEINKDTAWYLEED